MSFKTRHWDRLGNGGLTFTEMGFGAAPLGNLYTSISDDEAGAILTRAWDLGVRYYDTAPLYGFGLSETRLNRFLRDKPRDEYVLSSKVGRLLQPCPPDQRDGIGKWFDVPSRKEVYDYTYDGVMRSVDATLERLGVYRIDMLFVHDIDLANQGSQQALDAKYDELMAGGYRALIELRDQEVIKAFGVGVNEWQPCQTLAKRGDFDMFLLAGRYTLLEQDALETFLPLVENRGLGIVLGGPYNSGILATGPRKGSYYNYEVAPQNILDRVARIESICTDHNTRMIDAAFQFPLLHPNVVSVIPGGQGVSEVDSNGIAAKTVIPAALWTDLKEQGLMRADAPV
ncbi:MAG: D-threo-aldose 1-dehydrogenase [Paracoccaceae bacterium]|jgi:D-threo-aldose 1-dehydrogenase